MQEPRLAVRNNRQNPNRNLWNNNGTWWLHYTVHLPNYTKERVRESLHTRSVVEARRRRDARFRDLRSRVDREITPVELALAA